LRVADADEIHCLDPKKIATRVRRIFRHWVKVKALERITLKIAREYRRSDGTIVISAQIKRLAEMELKRQIGKGKFRFFGKDGGFLLLGSPDILEQCLDAVILQCLDV
jgi:hypothetical protein